MSSDEVDQKTEEENTKETESSAEENEEKNDAKEDKVNSKPATKKKNAEPQKIKQPAKKRVKTEQEETKKEDKKEEKKKVTKKDEDDDESEEDDDDEETDKAVPLLDQPLEITGSRKRKEVQRFVPKTPEEDNKEVKIPEGKGKALGSIEVVDFNIQRAKPEILKILHRLCFKGVGKAATLKKNIKQFNGWEFDESSEEFEKKKTFVKTSFKKVTTSQLKSVCMILEIERGGHKDDILDRILNFLAHPVDSGKTIPKGRSKRKGAASKNYDEGDETFNSKKKEKKRGKAKKKNVESEEESDVEDEDSEKEEENVKQNNTDKKKENSKLESEPEAEEEEEDKVDEEEKPKKGAKKGKKAAEVADKKAPPKKRAAAKKAAEKAADSEDAGEGDDESEGEDEPLVKKTKTPPTDDELVTFIKGLLEGANLELITMKKVCQDVYAKYSDFDLTHKKEFIKTTVKNLISS